MFPIPADTVNFIGYGLTLSLVEFFALFLSIHDCNQWFH